MKNDQYSFSVSDQFFYQLNDEIKFKNSFITKQIEDNFVELFFNFIWWIQNTNPTLVDSIKYLKDNYSSHFDFLETFDSSSLDFFMEKNTYALTSIGDVLFALKYKGETVEARVFSGIFLDLIRQNVSEFSIHNKLVNFEQSLNSLERYVVISGVGGQLFYVSEMIRKIKVNPLKIMALNNDDLLKTDHSSYQIKINQNEDYKVYELVEIKKKRSEEEYVELEIISHSLNHEINNPLGGIIALLGYLEMIIHDEKDNKELQVDFVQFVDEIRMSVKRVRNLSELFLCTNKTKPIDENITSWEDFYDHIRMLLSFRLIDLGLKIDFKIVRKGFSSHFDSAFILINYLMLNEMLTLLSHDGLVQNISIQHIEIEITVEDDSVKVVSQLLQVPHLHQSLYNKLKNSRFFSYLLSLSSLELELTHSSLRYYDISSHR